MTESPFEPGHEHIFRVTATGDRGPAESRYYTSPHMAAFWRDQLRLTGYRTVVGVVPAEAFEELDDATLDALAQEERNSR